VDEGQRLADRIRLLARVAREEGVESLTVHPDGTLDMRLGAAPSAASSADISKLREADEARRQRLRYAHTGGGS
jgi:hypothetical protein